ncbi:MAG: hypothetical protein Q8M94_21410 [Ignavibacteria bacterium]|nr:hypothetical protein [Ignavibacteria bacterium]
MRHKIKLFSNNNQEVLLDYSDEGISSDGGIVISERIEKESGLIKKFCKNIDHKFFSFLRLQKFVDRNADIKFIYLKFINV